MKGNDIPDSHLVEEGVNTDNVTAVTGGNAEEDDANLDTTNVVVISNPKVSVIAATDTITNLDYDETEEMGKD